MSEKRVAPPDGGSGDLVLIQRHLENLSAGEILGGIGRADGGEDGSKL